MSFVLSSTDGKAFFPRARVLWCPGGLSKPTAEPTDEIPWLLDIECRKSRWLTSDRFRCVFALFGDPNYSYGFWGTVGGMNIAIEIGFDEATLKGRESFLPFTRVFKGFVDKIEQDVVKGTVTITGRDFPSAWHDSGHSESYDAPNAKDIIQNLADAHGYTVTIDDAFNVELGHQVKDEKSRQTQGYNSREINQQDMHKLINDYVPGAEQITDHENGVINFVIKPEQEAEAQEWVINAPLPDFLTGAARHNPSNFTSLKFEHTLAFADSPQVMGIWEKSDTKEAGVIPYPPDGNSDSLPNPHMFVVSGDSIEDATRSVEAHHYNFTGREWMLEWVTSNPNIIKMTPKDRLLVICPGTEKPDEGNGGPYGVDSIELRLNARNGFEATISGKIGRS